ncbi:MAG: glycosyltransferase family 4 protein [Treponema sp.]|nr:glycosyltransferase family 4 protein [Treponema sp.]
MTICVDCRMINASGIGVYLRECLPFLLKSANSFLLLGDADILKSFKKNVENTVIIGCNIKPFSAGELFFFPKQIAKHINTAGCYYSPFFNIPKGIKIPVFTTIHDIIFPDLPELTSRLGLAARMWFYRRAFRHSKKIFTVSEFSKSRIKHYSKNFAPVIVTHSAIQPHFLKYRKENINIKKKEHIIFIGNVKQHKGLNYLLEAFCLAKSEGLPHQLVIIGSKDNFRTVDNTIIKKINSLDPEAVQFTGFISGEKLMDCLSAAVLLVQPSLYEGFGLPPLESMILGTQALISDIPVFKEIYKDFPVMFFRAGDTDDLKEKLLSILCNKKPGRIKLPEDLKKRYTFEKTSKIVLAHLEDK